MKLYIICINNVGYDCYDSFCIVANDESKVRELASSNSADEGSEIWKSDRAVIKEIGIFTGTTTEPCILMASFNAG